MILAMILLMKLDEKRRKEITINNKNNKPTKENYEMSKDGIRRRGVSNQFDINKKKLN